MQLNLDDQRIGTRWGGRRSGAGRPAPARPVVHHVKRPPVPRHCPAHVTLRVRPGIPSLRSRRFVDAFERSLACGSDRGDFRVVQYSLQRDHAHLIIEAAGKGALGRGMKSVASRLARAVNRVFRRRGRVLMGRYHLRVLRSPREVRSALAYVLLNARRHWRKRTGAAPPVRIDAASSGRWFDGWRSVAPVRSGREPPVVARARTWLLSVGWRRHGLIDPAEVPGAR